MDTTQGEQTHTTHQTSPHGTKTSLTTVVVAVAAAPVPAAVSTQLTAAATTIL